MLDCAGSWNLSLTFTSSGSFGQKPEVDVPPFALQFAVEIQVPDLPRTLQEFAVADCDGAGRPTGGVGAPDLDGAEIGFPIGMQSGSPHSYESL